MFNMTGIMKILMLIVALVMVVVVAVVAIAVLPKGTTSDTNEPAVTDESKEHEHDFSGKLKYNETEHWEECKCGLKNDWEIHTFGEWETTVEATETNTGSKTKKCTKCDYKETVQTSALEHTHVYSEEWKSNDTDHWHECKCGSQKDTANHIFTNWVTEKQPTETTKGSQYSVCNICGYKQTKAIAELTHTHTFDKQGSNGTSHWNECRCGEKENTEQHKYGEWTVTEEATETTTGSRFHECTVCKYKEIETLPLAPHVHDYGDWKTNGTSHWKECRCGEKIETAQHGYGDWTVTEEATETTTGSQYKACSVCGNRVTESIPMIPHVHVYGDWQYDDMNHWRTCICGNVAAHYHEYGEWVITQAATEQQAGSKYTYCNDCGYKCVATIPRLPHVHGAEGSYYSADGHWRQCRCGEIMDYEAHKMGEWVVTKNPTITTEGSQTRSCSACEYTQTEVIAKLPHTHEYSGWKYSSTYHWKECTCGNTSDKASHTFGEWVVSKEPTATTTGTRTRYCSVCQISDSQTMPKSLVITSQPVNDGQPLNSSSSTNSIRSVITVAGGQTPYSFTWEKKVNNSWVSVKKSSSVYTTENDYYNYDDQKGIYTFRCRVRDNYGYEVVSNEFTHNWYKGPELRYSTSYSAGVNGTITVALTLVVDSSDPNTYSFQWMRKTSDYQAAGMHDGSYYTGTRTATLKLYGRGTAETFVIYCNITGSMYSGTMTKDITIKFS